MRTVYNAQGESREVEAVDAREYVESGRWFFNPPAPPEPEPEPQAQPAPPEPEPTATPSTPKPAKGK